MKRTLSLILAALLLASSMTACGNPAPKETEAAETKAPATDAPDTNAPETDPAETVAPAPSYDTSLLVENGVAKAHIVLLDNASEKEKTAAEELAYHINLVSGAEVSVVSEANADSLPIIIATPQSLPELEELFPEDLQWLRTLGEIGDMERYGDDGFAIRTHEGKIYIFGAVPEGALNGVYDFIEENMGVLWVLDIPEGTIYDEMPTIDVVKTDYREKSPFQFRWGPNSAENKYSAIKNGIHGHNIKYLLTTSPLYDPECTEYWETDIAGNPLSADYSQMVNFWSEKTADTVAASVIQILDSYSNETRPEYWSVSQDDIGFISGVYPEMNEPFEYAPGQFISPSDPAYLSTVFYTFINRVTRQVTEKYPDIIINTYSYTWTIVPPVCDLEDNIIIWYCQYNEDYNQPHFSVALEEAKAGDSNSLAVIEASYYEQWIQKHPNVHLYTYYYTHYVVGWYERPIWYRMQADLQYYAETGALGMYTESTNVNNHTIYTWQEAIRDPSAPNPYAFTFDQARRMNLLTYWLMYKLCWNPYEDVDALIVEFCDKVYGDASPYMQEYYALLHYGWNYGSTEILPYEYNAKITLSRDQQYYFDYFLDMELEDGTSLLDAITAAITNAWEAADDNAKELLRWPYEAFSEDWTRFLH